MHRRGQGTFEYVLLLGGVLLIVVLAIFVLQNTFNQSSQGLSEIEMKKCKAAAGASPACFESGMFQPRAPFSSWEIPEGTLCDCSNYNPDAVPGAAEQQAEFGQISALYFADAGSIPSTPVKLTRLSLVGGAKNQRLVLKHPVPPAYSGPLVVVLPVSKDRIERVWVGPFAQPSIRESLDGSGLTILTWDQFRLFNQRQAFSVVAYLKPMDFKSTQTEIQSKIPKVAVAKPVDVPAGFSEYVYPGAAQSSLTCIPQGNSCANPLGPSCCAGLSCDLLSGITCKVPASAAPIAATPLPSPSLLPVASASPAISPTPLPTLPTPLPTLAATPVATLAPEPTPLPTPEPTPSVEPSSSATPSPAPSSTPVPTPSPSVTPMPSATPTPAPTVALKDCVQPVTFSFSSVNVQDGYCGQWNAQARRYENRWNFLNSQAEYVVPSGYSAARLYVNDYGAFHGSQLNLRINDVALDKENPNDANYNFPTVTAWVSGAFTCGFTEHAYPYKEVAAQDGKFVVRFFDASSGGAKGATFGGGFKAELRFKAATCPADALNLVGVPLASPTPAPTATPAPLISPSPSPIPMPSSTSLSTPTPTSLPTIGPTPSPSPTPVPTPNCLVQMPFLQIGCQPTPSPTPLPSPTPAPVPAFDSLVFSTGQSSFRTSATDTATVDLSYVLVQSSLDAPFDFGTAKARSFYYVTDSTPAGKAVQGMIFYQDPTTSYFVPYVHADYVKNPLDGSIAKNLVKYAYGAQSANLLFNANGIETGRTEPDFTDFVIFVPDGPGGSSFQIDVGYGDQATPWLGSSTQSGVAYG